MVVRRSRRDSVMCAVLVLSAGLRATKAEPVSLVLPKAPAGDRAFTVAGSDARGASTPRARVGFDFSTNPLVVLTQGGREYTVVSRQALLEPGISFGLAERLLFAAELPLVISETGGERPFGATPVGAGDHGFGLGDALLSARARLLGNADSPFKGSFRIEGWLPTGNAEFASDDRVRLRPSIGLSLEGERVYLAFESGFLFRRHQRLPGLVPERVGSALAAGTAVLFAVDRSQRLELGGELTFASVVGSGARLFDPRSTTGQALFTGHVALSPLPFVVSVGAGPGLGQGAGAADLRTLARIAYSPEAPPPPPDADGDGIADSMDACPRVRGVPSGDPLMNGCPALPTDTDGDTVPDVRDACPRRPGLPNRDPKVHGCPPAPPAPPAPPPPPPPPRATLVEKEIVISEQVQFETDTAVIRPESDALLTDVARVLREHPELVRVEVEGHTDSTGTREHNQKLSEERARAVMAWLVTHGIAAERLSATGRGQDAPIATNDDEAGRAKNRRVQFRVLEQKPKEAP